MIVARIASSQGPAARPRSDYHPVLVEASRFEGETLHYESRMGRPLASDRAVRAIVVRGDKSVGEVWLADFEIGRCRVPRHTDDDPLPRPGDRILWLYKIDRSE
jgi:hypothetical protein